MEFDPETFGTNVRTIRQMQRLSRRELARRSGVHEDTLARVESGRPSQPSVRRKITVGLGMSQNAMRTPVESHGETLAVHRASRAAWATVRDERPQAHRDAFPPLDEAERRRLAGLGLAVGFQMPFACRLAQGELVAGLIEAVKLASPPPSHGGEEFVTCLRGRVRLHVGSRTIDLERGDAATFMATEPHNYEPLDGPESPDYPPLLLYVNRIVPATGPPM